MLSRKELLGRGERESERVDKMRWQAKWRCSSLPSPEAGASFDLHHDIHNGQPWEFHRIARRTRRRPKQEASSPSGAPASDVICRPPTSRITSSLHYVNSSDYIWGSSRYIPTASFASSNYVWRRRRRATLRSFESRGLGMPEMCFARERGAACQRRTKLELEHKLGHLDRGRADRFTHAALCRHRIGRDV